MDDGGCEIDHRLEAAVCLVASHSYALEFLQLAEGVLDRVAPFVNVLGYREAERAFDAARLRSWPCGCSCLR